MSQGTAGAAPFSGMWIAGSGDIALGLTLQQDSTTIYGSAKAFSSTFQVNGVALDGNIMLKGTLNGLPMQLDGTLQNATTIDATLIAVGLPGTASFTLAKQSD